MTQTDELLRYLKRGKKITPLEALHLFGCFRLGARIYDIKQRGIDIASKMVERKGKYVKQYWIA